MAFGDRNDQAKVGLNDAVFDFDRFVVEPLDFVHVGSAGLGWVQSVPQPSGFEFQVVVLAKQVLFLFAVEQIDFV